ncbi:MAG: phage tail length tape measure family protein, partial [Paracoccus sp. (in: a-proteobacteria)]
MSANVGVLKATLGLDSAGFSAGIEKAKTGIAGLSSASAAAGRDMRSAAGANANLVSQFNDIGVMLAAGQNPLQLALQQGTQISQVLTQMGGGVGALRALGSAFVGMLNPISLATIGVIG